MFSFIPATLLILLYVSNLDGNQLFRCPQLTKVSNGSGTGLTVDYNDICVCLTKQLKIVCRLRNYNRDTFAMVSRYFENLERGMTYEARYLSKYVFNLCLNTDYAPEEETPRITIDYHLTSRIQFNTIVITFCEQRHTQPVAIDLNPHFLALQAETLTRLEIEITSVNDEQVKQLFTNLAHSIMGLQRLRQLVIWMGEMLKLTIPRNLFASYSPQNYIVPLEDITFIDDHLKVIEVGEEIVTNYQVLTIKSFGLKNLRQLKFISFQNVFVESIDEFAFSLLDHRADRLTINFTTDSLQRTQIDPKAFMNIGRSTTIYFSYYNQHQIKPQNIFIPSEAIFSQFLIENQENRIVFGYRIDCKNNENIEKIKWLIESRTWLKNQVELYCADYTNIFDIKIKTD